MPTPRCSYGATYIDDRIVVVGGEELTMVLNVVEIYDIADGKWSTGPAMPTPRHAEVVATVGNTVYCICGANWPTQRPRRDGRCARFQVRADRENFSLRALLEPLEPVLV